MMLLHKGKPYYPLEVNKIIGKNGKILYDKSKRNKSYAYIAVVTEERKMKHE